MGEADIQKFKNSVFEEFKNNNKNGDEYWSARDFCKILDYQKWEKFLSVIEKAKEACKNSGHNELDHFPRMAKMVDIGSGAKRDIGDLQLSRYACYLIVQNADPSKKVVALGQTYFAIQTRKQEIQDSVQYQNLKSENEKRLFLREEMKHHNLQLASAAKDAGVIEPLDYAIFQDHGYKGLYGGLGAKDIHHRKGLKKSQQILDHMGSTELAANLFRATQTEEKIKREKIKGKVPANNAHFEVGKKVRQTIAELGGTMPEELPPAESIKSFEKRKDKELKARND
ncbi:MAG: DNA-damage-inducible protein family protein [Ignavibacteria bacterium]|nr:DNA-damage-inducible protein family protein [Ignavibacteria bacterium]